MVILIVLLLVAATVSARSQEIPEAPLAWEREVAGRVITLSVSPDGRCVVAATTRGLVLLDANDTLRWQRPYFNRWMAATVESIENKESIITISPECRWMAINGTSNYRYVRLVGANGVSLAPIATPGTPVGIAINHRGDELVVGTAAGHLLFVNSRGRVLRDVRFKRGIFDAVEFSPDDAFVLTSEAGYTVGLFTRAGDTVWTRSSDKYIFVWPSADWERFVVKSAPWHGLPINTVEILARDGRTIWQRDEILAATVQIINDGHRFVVSSAPESDEFENPSLQMTPTMLDRDGNVLSAGELSAEQPPPVDLAVRCVASAYDKPLVCRDQNGKGLWQVSDILGQKLWSYTPDLTLIATAQTTGAVSVVRAYRPRRVDVPVEAHAGKVESKFETDTRPNQGSQPTLKEGMAEP